MDLLYAKTILYAYPDFEEIIVQIDDVIEKRAVMSLYNYSPALGQYEKIIKLMHEKDVISAIKIVCDKALAKFTDEELKYFRYKYFRTMSKREKENFDYSSRTYFRRQLKLTEDFASLLEGYRVNDKFFEEHCLTLNYFSQVLIRTKELEASLSKADKYKPIAKEEKE